MHVAFNHLLGQWGHICHQTALKFTSEVFLVENTPLNKLISDFKCTYVLKKINSCLKNFIFKALCG